MSVAELQGVTKRFGAVTALDDVTVSILPATTVALLGPNGAGKSTLIALLLGLRRPDSGCVSLLGGDPRHPLQRRRVGYAPQDVGFPQTLRVREVARLVADHVEAADTDDVLDAFGVLGLARRQVGGLSGGQRRRLAVALAFLGEPRLVVLDEPTAGLDADGRRAVWQAIEHARRRDASILLATHDLDEAEAVATRVVALSGGRVAAHGSVAEITARAGLALVRFRAPPGPLPAWLDAAFADDGRVAVRAADPGALVRDLVHECVPLDDLEVRPLALEEALAALLAGAA
ncbi:MAG TPA: ABC transporter ATP-binding protein [Gaiellaceae bacterium]|nr:ABC transporter ATP-binding protein [Gaiellaceae bacterium]